MVEINYTVAESLASGAKPTDWYGASGRHRVTGTCQKKSKIQAIGGKKHRERHKNCQKETRVHTAHSYGFEFVALAPLNVESGQSSHTQQTIVQLSLRLLEATLGPV